MYIINIFIEFYLKLHDYENIYYVFFLIFFYI